MIVKIEAPVDSCRHALDYNEGKRKQGVAELIDYVNMDSCQHDDIYETFAQYEKTQYYIRRLSFHASINPSDEDRCSQDDIRDFVRDMMGHLGLGEQPYLLYRHFDIDRPHYHVVSIRADKNGRKIEEYKERQRLRSLMTQVQDKYHFKVVEKRQSRSARKEVYPRRFNPMKEVSAQLCGLVEDALRYSFNTDKDFFAILKSKGVKAEYFSQDNALYIGLQGLDRKSRAITHMVSDAFLGVNLHEELFRKFYIKKDFTTYISSYVVKDILKSFKESISEKQFAFLLNKEGISVQIQRNEDDGKVEDITFICRSGKFAISISSKWGGNYFKDMIPSINNGKWVRITTGNERSSMRDLRQQRTGGCHEKKVPLSTAINLLKPLSQAKGESGAGYVPPKTEEELYEEHLAGQTGSMFADFTDRTYEEKLK